MEAVPSDAADVVIVGGGVNALVCALVLARADLSVLLIEDRPEGGAG